MILHPQHSDRKDLIGVQCSRAISLQQITRGGGTSERGETADTASVQDSFIPLASLRPPTARRAGGSTLPRCAPTPRCHHPNISSASSGLTALLSSWRAQADNLLQLQSFTHSLSRCQAHRHSRQRSHFILLSPARETNSAT